jgi:hypothetical protein
MLKKRFSAEQTVTLLRQIEVSMGQGNSTQISCREAGISEQNYATHSALNYRPPAPQTFAPLARHLDEIIPMQ